MMAATEGFLAQQMAEARRAVQLEEGQHLGGLSQGPAALCLAELQTGGWATLFHMAFLSLLKEEGLRLQAFHTAGGKLLAGLEGLMTGRPARMLDAWIYDRETLAYLLRKQSEGCRLASLEGAGGFFDGLSPDEAQRLGTSPVRADSFAPGSLASLAAQLGLPVILVLPVQSRPDSLAVQVQGFLQRYEEAGRPGLAGLALTEIGDEDFPRYKQDLEAMTGLPVCGYLPPLEDCALPLSLGDLGNPQAAHWGLLRQALSRLNRAARGRLDTELLLRLAEGAAIPRAEFPSGLLALQRQTSKMGTVRLAVAFDEAFAGYNQDNLELLAESGAQLEAFSPLSDSGLPPDCDGLYLGGAYHVGILPELSRRQRLGQLLARAAERGLPIYAEAQGSVFLSSSFTLDGRRYPMSGLLKAESQAVDEPAQPRRRLARQGGGLQLSLATDSGLPQGSSARDLSAGSYWQPQYCRVDSSLSAMVMEKGDSWSGIGQPGILAGPAARQFLCRQAGESFQAGASDARIHALALEIPFYAAPDLVARFLDTASRYQRERRGLI